MQIKKYVAATLKEAIEEMKSELGDEAIVLSTRVIEGQGPRGQKMFEITAGMDSGPAASAAARAGIQSRPGQRPPLAVSEESSEVDLALEALRQKIYQAKNQPEPPPAKPPMPSELRSDFKKPSAPASNYGKPVPPAQRPIAKEPPASKPKSPAAIKNIPRGLDEEPAAPIDEKPRQRQGGAHTFLLENLKHGLLEKDIQPAIVNQLIGQLTANVPFLKPADIDTSVISTMATMIPCSGFEITKRKSGKIISVVGPTGVGKTTCIAKLAVISKLLHKLDIGLISVDTYRLGAIDQLKIFSEISDIDFLVAYEAKELPALVNKFKNKDIIFLDTAGRSQNNIKHLQEMKSVMATVNISETILVMNAASATATLLDTAKKFAMFNYTGFIFTKLDEAVTYGNLLNVVHKFNVPIKYLTNGQVIPDDIIAADSEHIANIIYSGKVVAA